MPRFRLSPGCMIAHTLARQGIHGEACSIEFLRACIESAPTFPEVWTVQEGADFAAVWEGR